MQIIDKGSGTPLVLVPGLQGRWEYMRGTADALARSFRVLTFSLCGERSSGLRLEPAKGLDNYPAQIRAVLDERRVDRAIICGVSFGGIVAVKFAAAEPDRTRALVLASTPGPQWHLRRRHQIYVRAPRIFGPVFLAETPLRVREEIAAALPARLDRLRFGVTQLSTLLRAPVSLGRMGERGRLISTLDLVADCARITAPTLVVTGERGLDQVVPESGPSEYLRAIAGAHAAVIERTGHLGSITRPDVFAAIVREFVERQRDAAA